MVKQRSLVEIHHLRRWLPYEYMTRQFEHIVCITCFGGDRAEMLAEAMDREKELVVAIAADYVAGDPVLFAAERPGHIASHP